MREVLKRESVVLWRISVGKEFHRAGAETEKERSPKVILRERGTLKRRESLDVRSVRGGL